MSPEVTTYQDEFPQTPHSLQLSLASHLRRTPLDLARRSRCKSCVRALEAHAVLWQGWVDHEQKLLMTIGSWDRRSARSASILISHDGSMVLYMDMVLDGSQEIFPVMLAFMLALMVLIMVLIMVVYIYIYISINIPAP